MSTARKWVIVVAAMIPQTFAWGLAVGALTLWAVPWMKTYSASHGQIMATTMFMLLGIGVFGPIGGYIAERIAVRNLIAAGLTLVCLTFLLQSRATAMWQITLLYAIPLAAGLVLTSAMMGQILAVKLFESKPGLAIGVVSMGASLGSVVTPLIVHKLLSLYPWQTAIVILAVCGAAFLPGILFVIPKLARPREADDKRTHVAAASHLPLRAILTDRIFVGSLMVVMILNFLFNAVFYNLGPYLADIGADPASTARIISIQAVPAFLGTMTFPALADRIDYRVLLLFGALCIGGGTAATAAGAGVAGMLIILPVMALAVGGLYSLLPAIMAQRFGQENFERVTGLTLPFVFLGSIGSFAAGVGRDHFGSYPRAYAVLLVLVVIPIIGLLILAVTPKGRRTSVGQQQQEGA
jgi:OFA family oxalate/formate antiporter-like MFS transporter